MQDLIDRKLKLLLSLQDLRLIAQNHIKRLEAKRIDDFEIEQQKVYYQIKHFYLADNAMIKIEKNEPYLLN